MRTWPVALDTRVYSTADDDLVLTYYTDIRVQNAAPVRKSFFNLYAGDVVIVSSEDAAAAESAALVEKLQQRLQTATSTELAEAGMIYRSPGAGQASVAHP
jgi:hypothetical protein